jgi:site-specific recombinase XerD
MLNKPISPMLQRMIEDMTARRFKEKVQKDYARHVGNFTAFLGRSPDTATSEDVRLFQVDLAKRQIGAPTINSAVAALRFFFNVTLERPQGNRISKTGQQVGEKSVIPSGLLELSAQGAL